MIKEGLHRKALLLLVSGLMFLNGCAIVDYKVEKSKYYRERVAEEPLDKKVDSSGLREDLRYGDDKLTLLYVNGSPYEMGFQHGRLMRKEVGENVNSVLRGFEETLRGGVKMPLHLENIVSRRATYKILSDAGDIIWVRMPREDQEELMGLSDGSGIPLDKLKMIHALPEIAETSCSLISANKGATADGRLYQVRVLDFATNLGIQNNPVVIFYKPKNQDSFAFSNVGWAGFIGVVSGMSDKLAVSEAGYGKPRGKRERPGISRAEEDYSETIHGTPMIFQLKEVLGHGENVEQATGILRAASKTSDYAFIVSSENDSRGYLSTRNMLKVFRFNDPYPLPALPNIIYGSHDDETCYARLKADYGKISPQVLMEDVIPAIAMKGNLHVAVYDLQGKRMWVANAKDPRKVKGSIRACDGHYFEIKIPSN